MKIHSERLMNDIKTYATYGEDPAGGITRPCFSEADYAVREKFVHDLKDMGLAVTVDPIANIWGRYTGAATKTKPIVIGSHLDTVPNGGAYDGALGVLIAKEVIQTIIDNNIDLRHPLEVVSFTGEEANDFNLSTMGSRTLRGKIDRETLLQATDSTGTSLAEAVKRAGGNVNEVPMANKEIASFLEVHIEQGQRLENTDLPVGVVDNIVGIYRDQITVQGKANHAGTTMMEDRADALTAASEIALVVEDVLRKNGTEAVATVGKFDVHPNAANIIPGKVELIVEIRSRSKVERYELRKQMGEAWAKIAERRNVELEITNFLDQAECTFDAGIVHILEQTAEQLDVPYTTFSSMAGHDATHIADIAKTAMLFVKSIGGISHNPDEYSTLEDIETAANILLQAVLKIDKAL